MLLSFVIVPQLWRGWRAAFFLALAGALAVTGGMLYAIAHPVQFSAGAELVEVYVSVADSAGKPVTGLAREAFTILEDGVPQEVTTFAAGTMPLALGIAVDRSFSMAGRPLSTAKAGAIRLLESLQPGDRTMLVAVG